MKNRIALFTLFLLMFTACAAPPAPTTAAPPSPTPAHTASPLPPAATPAPDGAPATAAAALTQAAASHAAATARAATATANAPTPDWEATDMAIGALLEGQGNYEVLQTFDSPDGAWRVEIIRYGCAPVGAAENGENAFEQLILTRLDDGSQTIAAEQLQYCGGVGAYGFNGLYWSPNSRYFYFDEARESVPDGCCCGLWQPWLSRIAAASGERENLPGGGAPAPGGLLTLWNSSEIVLWDLDGGEISRTPFPAANLIVHSFQLSPDGTRLAYVLVEQCYVVQGRSLVVLFSLADRTHTLLVDSDAPTFASAAWETDTLLTILDRDGNRWQYDLITGELTPP
jgi:hypothetical protein